GDVVAAAGEELPSRAGLEAAGVLAGPRRRVVFRIDRDRDQPRPPPHLAPRPRERRAPQGADGRAGGGDELQDGPTRGGDARWPGGATSGRAGPGTGPCGGRKRGGAGGGGEKRKPKRKPAARRPLGPPASRLLLLLMNRIDRHVMMERIELIEPQPPRG